MTLAPESEYEATTVKIGKCSIKYPKSELTVTSQLGNRCVYRPGLDKGYRVTNIINIQRVLHSLLCFKSVRKNIVMANEIAEFGDVKFYFP